MAAIAGIISTKGEKLTEATEKVQKAVNLMHHRGPDNKTIKTLPDRTGALGAAEVNLTPERTQCAAVANSPYIVFDGELFNDRPEGQTDIELFKEYYQKYGKGCFTHLEGSYSCAVVDNGETIIARDAVGARPLFYGTENDLFCFSTEMKGLIGSIRFDMHELEPGHIYSTKEGLKPFEPYFADVPEPENLEHATKVLRDLMIEAIRKRMRGVNTVSLSGGLDSSIIAAVAKQYNKDLHLFTGAIESADAPDLENAKLMADFLGAEHNIYYITDQDIAGFIPQAVWYLESFDEDCISGVIANYYVSKMAKQYCDTIMVGEGADELFGGYRMVLKSEHVTSDEHREELAKKLLAIAYNTALRRLDRGWMANGVVYQTPFLDPKVLAFSRKIPMEWKIYGENQTEKHILREAFKDMLPERIYKREKLRFAMGTGIDDVMDRIVSTVVDPEGIKETPKSYYGMPFATFKELYYYDEFLRQFPAAYEKQTIRWDPFK
ncbi:MAG: asparagine synthase-related protein [Chloroflexota bacterium]